MSQVESPFRFRRFHRLAIQAVGSGRLCEDVDLIVMLGLVKLGFIAVRRGDRRLVLTKTGRRVWQELRFGSSRLSPGSES